MKRQSASNSPGEIEAKSTTMDVNIIDEVKQQFEQNKEDPRWAMIGLVIAKVEQLQQENLQQRKLIDKLFATSTIEGKSHKSSIYHFLPLETNLEILAFIDKRTVLRCLRPVCRWFRDVTARDYLRSLFRGRIKFSMIYSGIGSYKLWSSYTGSFDNKIMFNQIHGSDRIYSHYAYVFDATYEGRIYKMHVNTYKQDKYYDRPYSFFDEELTLRTLRSTVFRSSTSFLLGISKINLILKTSTCELYRFQTVNTVFYPLTGYGKNEAVYFDETDESLLLDWLLNEVSNEEASDPIFRRLHFQFRSQDRLVIANPIEFIRRAEQRFCALPENYLLPDMMELKFHFESNFRENTRKSTVNENCYCPAGFRTEKYNHNYTFVAFSYLHRVGCGITLMVMRTNDSRDCSHSINNNNEFSCDCFKKYTF